MNTPIVLNTPSRALLSLPHAAAGAENVAPLRMVARVSLRRPRAAAIRIKHLLAASLLVSMVGCGTTSGDRAISGAGIGAGAGAVLGTVTGMGPGTGAAIGAAAGAATGGLTKKKQINLGKPLWR